MGERQRYINPNLVINGKQINCEGRSDLDPATGRRWYGPCLCVLLHDAEPLATKAPVTYVRDGIQDSIEIAVEDKNSFRGGAVAQARTISSGDWLGKRRASSR